MKTWILQLAAMVAMTVNFTGCGDTATVLNALRTNNNNGIGNGNGGSGGCPVVTEPNPNPNLYVEVEGSCNISSTGGLRGGHFDVDTSTATYAFSSGTTDGHVHEYDDKYNVTGIDIFNLLSSKLDSIDDILSANQEFVINLGNVSLSQGAYIQVNNKVYTITEFHVDQFQKVLTGNSQKYVLGTPVNSSQEQLRILQIFFHDDAIERGGPGGSAGLVRTQTGCVRKNDAGANGEYRNGALMLQALDASGYSIESTTGVQEHGESGLLYEVLLFWHDGPCYGS